MKTTAYPERKTFLLCNAVFCRKNKIIWAAGEIDSQVQCCQPIDADSTLGYVFGIKYQTGQYHRLSSFWHIGFHGTNKLISHISLTIWAEKWNIPIIYINENIYQKSCERLEIMLHKHLILNWFLPFLVQTLKEYHTFRYCL